MKAFTQIPFFRILIPLVAGILMAIGVAPFYCQTWWFLILLIPLALFNFYRPSKLIQKWLFMFCAEIFLFLFGITMVRQKNISDKNTYYANQTPIDTAITFIASINELPVKKEKFVKCEIKVREIKSTNKFQISSGTILGYFKLKEGMDLRPGQTLLIKTTLVELSPPKNPFEFDYRAYLNHKQIYHTAFVDSFSYAILPLSNQLNPLWALGLNCKEFILSQLKNSELDKNSYGICAALLTGYDDEIDKPVMEAFSHSGTLHVLSVSGLHTGLIYLALNFFFNFFDRKNKYKLLRLIFITLNLWFFALITGFSAPVLRAVIMFNLLGVGKIYFRARYSHQLNLLLVSAFILLVYNPFFITEVGFLLSYFALFGLLYFQPKFSKFWKPENKVLDSFWQSVTASFAATISTLPITLFYFKQFPLWFFVCNVVVVPATFLVLLLAVFVVLKLNFVAIIINQIISFLIAFIDLFNAENIGFIDNIHFTFIDVFFLSILIISLSVSFQYHSYKYLYTSFSILIVWQLFCLIDSYLVKNESLFTVYNVKKHAVFSVKNKTEVNLNELTFPVYNFNIKPHLNSFNYPSISESKFNVLFAGEQLVLFLNRPGSWPLMNYSFVTTVVVSNNFKLTSDDLSLFKNLKTVVIDASNNSYIAAKTEELSRNFGISFYNTKYRGAYLQPLQ